MKDVQVRAAYPRGMHPDFDFVRPGDRFRHIDVFNQPLPAGDLDYCLQTKRLLRVLMGTFPKMGIPDDLTKGLTYRQAPQVRRTTNFSGKVTFRGSPARPSNWFIKSTTLVLPMSYLG